MSRVVVEKTAHFRTGWWAFSCLQAGSRAIVAEELATSGRGEWLTLDRAMPCE